MAGTKLPSIPTVPLGPYKTVCDPMKEIIEVRNNRRGDPLDRFISLRELYSLLQTDATLLSLVAGALTSILDAEETVPISGGIAAASGNSNNLVLDTENGDASDDLDKITGYAETDVVMVRPANSSRVITIKRGDYFKMASDFALNSIWDCAEFFCFGGDIMVQRWRSNNA